mmetsp:Transcript_41141/g.103712  ORF Transcript_41141/g.103712 Transcript_41141/m.103712 type:complete len:741 (-) Transcript_41141:137-2359(-)|eukprot:CAMPEP_0177657402 /NCGR_PEP_ID=MMETSP0447-20121125/16161_1 /TAXON_ID=0 /ORGANISM="Stygamoeba regulata, Strain BSH-02190019" /LENGTH=740 /DNA_ID=CAMNT_0019161745 /DNA_START=196 /DNA_END=2418 /DNA_ORIENTATION=-
MSTLTDSGLSGSDVFSSILCETDALLSVPSSTGSPCDEMHHLPEGDCRSSLGLALDEDPLLSFEHSSSYGTDLYCSPPLMHTEHGSPSSHLHHNAIDMESAFEHRAQHHQSAVQQQKHGLTSSLASAFPAVFTDSFSLPFSSSPSSPTASPPGSPSTNMDLGVDEYTASCDSDSEPGSPPQQTAASQQAQLSSDELQPLSPPVASPNATSQLAQQLLPGVQPLCVVKQEPPGLSARPNLPLPLQQGGASSLGRKRERLDAVCPSQRSRGNHGQVVGRGDFEELDQHTVSLMGSKEIDVYIRQLRNHRHVPPDELRTLRRLRRLAKNRESAQQSRRRRKQYVTELEASNSHLRRENAQLRTENARLNEALRYATAAAAAVASSGDGGRAVSARDAKAAGVCMLVVLFSFGLFFSAVDSPDAHFSPLPLLTELGAPEVAPTQAYSGRALLALEAAATDSQRQQTARPGAPPLFEPSALSALQADMQASPPSPSATISTLPALTALASPLAAAPPQYVSTGTHYAVPTVESVGAQRRSELLARHHSADASSTSLVLGHKRSLDLDQQQSDKRQRALVTLADTDDSPDGQQRAHARALAAATKLGETLHVPTIVAEGLDSRIQWRDDTSYMYCPSAHAIAPSPEVLVRAAHSENLLEDAANDDSFRLSFLVPSSTGDVDTTFSVNADESNQNQNQNETETDSSATLFEITCKVIDIQVYPGRVGSAAHVQPQQQHHNSMVHSSA